MYKIRVVLDTQEDVIRTFTFPNNANLEQLHLYIIQSFGFNGQEMASFYRSDTEWNQGEEIPLFNMAEAGVGVSMATEVLQDALPNINDTLIYVYDFLAMWTFYVEVLEITPEEIAVPKTILSIGEIPKEAPEKEFKADDLNKDLDDEFNDDFDSFERLDDFDFDNY